MSIVATRLFGRFLYIFYRKELAKNKGAASDFETAPENLLLKSFYSPMDAEPVQCPLMRM